MLYIQYNIYEDVMDRIHLSKDVYSVSEVRSKISELIDKVKKIRGSILITQNGKGVAVLTDVKKYDELLDKLDIAEDIVISEQQIKEGKSKTNSQVKKIALNKLK